MGNILIYTTEQIEKIAQNYLLLTAKGFLRIEKFIKIFTYKNQMSFNGQESIEVRVKVTTKLGKVYTEKVYIHPNIDTPYKDLYSSVTGYGYSHKKVSELLDMDLLPNTVFEKSFEEAVAENNKKEAEMKHRNFISNLVSELNYNIKQNRKPTAAKRSYKKYTIEQLQDALPELNETQQKYLMRIIQEFNIESNPKETIKQFIASFVGAKKELFEQLEKSFEENEKILFTNSMKWFANLKIYQDLTEAQLKKEVEYYIEMQKWNLFKSAAKYLTHLDIKTCENILFNNTHNGFEGEWRLTMVDGSFKIFSTHTIIAEGLIQRAHYRYLVHLS